MDTYCPYKVSFISAYLSYRVEAQPREPLGSTLTTAGKLLFSTTYSRNEAISTLLHTRLDSTFDTSVEIVMDTVKPNTDPNTNDTGSGGSDVPSGTRRRAAPHRAPLLWFPRQSTCLHHRVPESAWFRPRGLLPKGETILDDMAWARQQQEKGGGGRNEAPSRLTPFDLSAT